MEAKIRLIGEGSLDKGTAAVLDEIASKGVVEEIVGLPDLHFKGTMETPSSLAVGVKEYVVPQLSSTSVNCGMALLKTNLSEDAFSPRRLDEFFSAIRNTFPYGTWKKTITKQEVLQAITRGADWALRRYDLDTEFSQRISQNGNCASDKDADLSLAERLHPSQLLEECCYNFGEIGKSNHFIEIQVVDEILSKEVGQVFGIEPGQVLIMYHGGGGAYCGLIGRLFVPRKKGSLWGKLYNLRRRKIPFHLTSAESFRDFLDRLNYYFVNRSHTLIPSESKEGKRILTYDKFSMNYGYAYRVAALSMIQRSLETVADHTSASLIYDLPHNVITREEIDGASVLVHRHNSTMAYPKSGMQHHPVFKETGQPVLLPGTGFTSSYLCVADDGAKDTLYSVDHGSGRTIMRHVQAGLSKKNMGRITRRYGYDSSEVQFVQHYDDVGINAVLGPLKDQRIVKPVARLRPIAGLT